MKNPFGIAVLLAALAACAVTPPSRPNLVLVTVDTLRADALACYGGEADVGTEICSLADEGTRFAWAFSAASFTLPSVASILTSKPPSFHGVRQKSGSRVREEALTVAQVLKEAGYRTAAVVSNPVLGGRRLGKGFDSFDHELQGRERNRPRYRERNAADTTDAALAWAKSAASPWFLWVHFQDPHGPYDPPGAPPLRDAPGARRLPVLDNDNGLGGIPRYQALPGLFTAEAYEQRYRDEIRYADREVGRLIRGLDSLGKRPGVLFTADHGEALGENGFWFVHGTSVALDQIHVPLLWRPPEPGESHVVSEAVSLVDVAPTLVQLSGAPLPEDFRGRPLPLGRAAAGWTPAPVFAEDLLSVAVISGSEYYVRPRVMPPPGPGASPADGARSRFGPRRATLGPDAAGTYRSADAASASELGSLVARFLGATRDLPPGEKAQEVPEEMRERMRALGYAE